MNVCGWGPTLAGLLLGLAQLALKLAFPPKSEFTWQAHVK